MSRKDATKETSREEDRYADLRLGNQLCFPLYACAKEVVRRYHPLLKELDLTYTQYITMMVLWEKESLTSKELGETLYLDSGTLTPLLRKMEQKGYLRRERSPRDERLLIIHLTEEGRALQDRALFVPEAIGDCLPLTEEEIGRLLVLLHKLLREMD